MSRLRHPKAADSITLAKPNTTDVHIQRPRPEKIRTGGLHSIAGTAKAYPSTNAQVASLKSARLELATSTAPVRNSTMRGAPYTCPELRRNPHRAGSADASRLPSLSSFSQPSKP